MYCLRRRYNFCLAIKDNKRGETSLIDKLLINISFDAALSPLTYQYIVQTLKIPGDL
jgi:hypothetical protein